jgi:hypothetical protein
MIKYRMWQCGIEETSFCVYRRLRYDTSAYRARARAAHVRVTSHLTPFLPPPI